MVTASLNGIRNYNARNLDFMNGISLGNNRKHTLHTYTAFTCIMNITMLSFENPSITELHTYTKHSGKN
jgi:predicted RNA-binding protein with PUA-like domain